MSPVAKSSGPAPSPRAAAATAARRATGASASSATSKRGSSAAEEDLTAAGAGKRTSRTSATKVTKATKATKAKKATKATPATTGVGPSAALGGPLVTRAVVPSEDGDTVRPARRDAAGTPSSGGIRKGLTLEQRRQQRRRDLLAAALELFGTKGYSATSIDELCRTAYVSTRNFYEEFAGREAVLFALLDDVAEEVFDALAAINVDAAPFPTGQPVSRRIEHEVRLRLAPIVHALLDDRRKGRIVLIEAIDAAPEKGEWRRRYDEAMVRYLIDLFRQILREVDADVEASIADLVQPKTQRYMALSVVGAVSQVLTDAVVQPDPPPIAETLDACTYATVRLLNVDGIERMVEQMTPARRRAARGPGGRGAGGSGAGRR